VLYCRIPVISKIRDSDRALELLKCLVYLGYRTIHATSWKVAISGPDKVIGFLQST
jgi:hypothetical protein